MEAYKVSSGEYYCFINKPFGSWICSKEFINGWINRSKDTHFDAASFSVDKRKVLRTRI